MTTPNRKTTRHDAASIVIGRRAQGLPARRRTSPPPHHQSDGVGHRNVQAGQDTTGREEPRRRDTGPHRAGVSPVVSRKRATSAPNTVRGARTGGGPPPPRVLERVALARSQGGGGGEGAGAGSRRPGAGVG